MYPRHILSRLLAEDKHFVQDIDSFHTKRLAGRLILLTKVKLFGGKRRKVTDKDASFIAIIDTFSDGF